MKKFIASLILSLTLSTAVIAGLPPTTGKVTGDSTDVTTFKYQFPNFTGTHTGTTLSLGVNSIAGGGTGQATAPLAATALLEDARRNIRAGTNSGDYTTTSLSTDNVALGNGAMRYMRGSDGAVGANYGLGYQALAGSAVPASNTGTQNIMIGYQAGKATTSGTSNLGIGYQSLLKITSGQANTAVGDSAWREDTTHNSNTAIGYTAGFRMFSADNTIVGSSAMGGTATTANNTGGKNTAIGANAGGVASTTAANSVLVGYNAGASLTTGSDNTFIGYQAGKTSNAVTSGANNTLIGSGAVVGAAGPTLTYQTCLGSACVVNSASTVVLGRTTDNTVIGATADAGTSAKLQVTGKIQQIDGSQAYGKVPVSDINGTLTLGRDPMAPINYVAFPNAENNAVTGFLMYKDAAGSTPVDAYEASPSATTTFTPTSSTPLFETYSYLITKDAADRQGEGVSYAFTIDTAMQAKVVTVEFYYSVATGTYADGDLAVFIYDVTNGALIPVAPSTILNVGTPSKWQGTFQTASNSTSYRLVWHVASTSASAYTVKIDNIKVGPQAVTYGAPVTDPSSYTPTITASGGSAVKGTTTKDIAYYRRVGNYLEVDYYYAQTVAGTAGTGYYTFNLPSGLSIDTTYQVVGTNGVKDIAGSNATVSIGGTVYEGAVGAATTTSFYIAVGNSATANNFLWVTGSGFIGDLATAAVNITAHFQVPITGWSSSVQMSSDADTRVVAASYKCTTADTVTSSDNVNYDTKVFDTHNAVTTHASTWKFTAPVSGYYRVTVGQVAASATANQVYIVKNGATYEPYLFTAAANEVKNGSATIQLNAGEYIGINNGTGTSLTLTSDATANRIYIEKISGPSQIAASETVAARYTSSVTAATSGAAVAAIVFPTKVYDTHGAYNSTTGVFTAPVSGKYSIKAGINTSAATASSVDRVITIYAKKASTSVAYTNNFSNSTSSREVNFPAPVTTVDLLAGEEMSIQWSHNWGVTLTCDGSASGNWIAIERVGN